MDFSFKDVSISSVVGGYPELFPYNPDEPFPEYRGPVSSGDSNPVYRAVRKNFMLLGYDKENYGTPAWNPLKHLVQPGNSVFIKPNLCSHEYGRIKEHRKGDLFSIITHPSVVRAVADYASIALQGRGEIIIGDNPTIDTNFPKLMQATGYHKFSDFYRKTFDIPCAVLDLRDVWCDDINNYGNKTLMQKLPGDPKGDCVINLGEKSFFYGLNSLLFRGVFTNRWDTIRHHHGKTQEYAVANSIYNSDVYISVPKLKTHHKVGATLNIKGLVGMCTRKNYLIHWRIGFPSWGGDEFPEPEKKVGHLLLAMSHLFNDVMPEIVRSKIIRWFNFNPAEKLGKICPYRGAWEGNDTCWRMAADLYLTLLNKKRKCFSVVDGVVGGDHNGPFCPDRQNSRTMISGENLLHVDAAAVRMMDFNVSAVSYIDGLLKRFNLQLSDVAVVSDDFDVNHFFKAKRPYLKFAAPTGWPHLPINHSGTENK